MDCRRKMLFIWWKNIEN